ncbi:MULTISPECIES: hypothetical protein [unclassified Ruegeria]|uniref:hypothetical protein n=1 Tax=unclassified Ruegeria TaxID=2625375 RepID=UPI00149204EF|nr:MULTISPECIES: hypothetical protein [unclassified Ruegeria]NOD49825.1 hypothetical protein [Ruegeria sp. HKCCD5849]NOD54185.1 hypothetical protein [Ruegeria sp. HKCCD5851]NOD70156.1 hypothetical protein [Ruegeria sp. HKCCD7303]
MPQYNDMFELSVEDIDLIESSLRRAQTALSHAERAENVQQREEREDALNRIQDLLGRLHDQKIFYRPKSGVYVGG